MLVTSESGEETNPCMTANRVMPFQGPWSPDRSACGARYFTLAKSAPRTISAATTAGATQSARCSQNSRRTRLRRVRLSALAAGGAPLGARSGAASATELLMRSEEHTSELQSPCNLVCRLLLEKKK